MGKPTAVSSFFRDVEAFAYLEQKVIGPMFMADRDPTRPIRVWIPGCSTGEEAYSVAMLLHDEASRSHKNMPFQIFATDIDPVALDTGRAGRYPTGIAANIRPERLRKYLVRDGDGSTLQMSPQLRDSIVFSAHSLVNDPPYSKLDLIWCRNLMIDFGFEQQQRLLPVLHYALNPGGYLFLGNSETLGSSRHLFRTLDHERKIFQRQELPTSKKEPLPSINDELIALNAELQNKINDLVRASTDIKNLLDNAQIGIIFLDSNLCVRRFTLAATKIVDLLSADVGRPLAQCVHRLRHDRLLEDAREVLETRQPKEMELQAIDARWYLTRILPYRTIDDAVDGVVLTFTDVTPLKESNEALQTSEEKFSKAFHLAPIMIAISDAHTGTILECNQRFLDVFGYTREEVLGKTKVDIGWLPLDVRTRFMERMATQGYVRDEEFTCRSKDGREHTCLYNGYTIDVRGQKQVVSMAQDISERKHSEEAIKATLRQEKDIVLRELAHRTKNNMFVIRSMLNLHAAHTQNEEVQRLFTDVEDKIFAMALVHQKLYQSKNLSRLDLGEYLRELVAALAESHSLKPARIAVSIEAESISALIDTAIPCGLVVTELVSNSFKHAFPNSRKGTISIRLLRKHPHTIQLKISDDGVGVPDNHNFRGQSTLGLETVFMIVEHQLKGTVHFLPSPRGLTCHIEFVDTLYSERV